MWIWVRVSFRVFLRDGKRKQEKPRISSHRTPLCRKVGLCTAFWSRLSHCCSLCRPHLGEDGATETEEAGTQALSWDLAEGMEVLELGRLQQLLCQKADFFF